MMWYSLKCLKKILIYTLYRFSMNEGKNFQCSINFLQHIYIFFLNNIVLIFIILEI